VSETASAETLRNKTLTPIEAFRQSINNPKEFWEKYSNYIKQNFHEGRFTINDKDANTAIIIPVHNDIEKGHLHAVLYALSQLKIPENKTIKIYIISHNSEDDQNKKLEEMLESIGNPVELIIYNNQNLRGPSYPIQLGVSILPDNIEEVGIIDDDTVVPPNWLIDMSEAIKNDYDIAVGRRTYLNEKGKKIPYSKIKEAFELFYKKPKLIMGNSYFRLKKLKEIIEYHLGGMIDDGFIEEISRKRGYKLTLIESATAVSDGQKYANFTPLELAKEILDRIRVIGLGATNIKDHVEFLLFFLPSYYPNFGEFIKSRYPEIYEDYNRGKIKDLEDLGKLYEQLKECYRDFNERNKSIMAKDIEEIQRVRALREKNLS